MSNQELQHPLTTPPATTLEPKLPFTPPAPEITSAHIADQLQKVIQPMKSPKPSRLTATLTQEIKDRQYRNFPLDLSVARSNIELGLRNMGIVATSMTIIRADSPFTYRLNSAGNDDTPAEKGLQETEFEIEEVYITNTAQTGQAIIRVVWNPQLIRAR